MSSRRNLLTNLLKSSGFVGLGGIAWGSMIDTKSEQVPVLRPPAALPEAEFLKTCIKCGACVTACPYDVLQLAGPESGVHHGTPYFVAREVPCYLCPDIPCVKECPTEALDLKKVLHADADPENTTDPKLDITRADMGLAIVDTESCVAHWGVQCDACYRACPLMDTALTLGYSRNERTGKHAFLKPIVHKDACTGCGICEHACITEKASIVVVPKEQIAGLAGSFYQKGWEEPQNQPIKTETDTKNKETDGAMDYLNNDWEDLIDE